MPCTDEQLSTGDIYANTSKTRVVSSYQLEKACTCHKIFSTLHQLFLQSTVLRNWLIFETKYSYRMQYRCFLTAFRGTGLAKKTPTIAVQERKCKPILYHQCTILHPVSYTCIYGTTLRVSMTLRITSWVVFCRNEKYMLLFFSTVVVMVLFWLETACDTWHTPDIWHLPISPKPNRLRGPVFVAMICTHLLGTCHIPLPIIVAKREHCGSCTRNAYPHSRPLTSWALDE